MSQPIGSTKISDLTLDDLRTVIREEMRDLVREVIEEMIDDEDDLAFRPKIAERLREYLRDCPGGEKLEDAPFH